MKIILFTSLLTAATIHAAPDGYYKQEYQFKKSSATYKNNQLETKNDDEGYYGKQGDLSGNIAPQVEQHNQHSEYISPSVDNVGHSLTTYNDRDLTQDAERAFRDHNILPGTNRHYSQTTYSTQSNLGQLTQNLQYNMEKQVRDALKAMQGQSGYGSTQIRSEDMQYLENQLKSNITRQLQQSLYNQYGAQTIKGQSSYSQSSGVANYDTNELAALRQQMERELMKKLHDGARTSYQSHGSSSSSSSSSSWNNFGTNAETDDMNHDQRYVPTSSSNYKPIPGNDDFQRPERLSYGQHPSTGSPTSYGQHSSTGSPTSYGSSSSYGSHSSQSGSRYFGSTYDRDFPTIAQSQITVNPSKRVTEVLQGVQNDLNQEVRNALNAFQIKYSAPSYTLTNTRPEYQSALDDFKRQLRYNLTRYIEDELERVYGHQEIRGEYSFSQNQRTNANYKTADLDDLKQQVENNLINYLETSFRNYETNYQQSRQQASSSRRDYSNYGPQYTQSLTSDIAHNPDHVRYEPHRSWSSSSSWSSQSSYGSGMGGSSSNQQPMNAQLELIRSQLQQDLNRQLQSAVYAEKSRSSYTSQSNSQVEQVLANELRANLTRQLEESLNQRYGTQGVRSGQSYSISSSGVYSPNANYRTEDLNRLRQQLQDDLTRNLQEQLRTSSYSTSSGGYNSGYMAQGPGQTGYEIGLPRNDFHQNEDDILQKAIDDGDIITSLQIDNQRKPIRGDMGQSTPQTPKPRTEDLVQKYVDGEEMAPKIEDGMRLEEIDNLQKPMTDEDFGLFELSSQRKPVSHTPRQENNFHQIMFGSSNNQKRIGQLQSSSQSAQGQGQEVEDLDQTEPFQKLGQHIEIDNFQTPMTDDDFGQFDFSDQRKPVLVGQHQDDDFSQIMLESSNNQKSTGHLEAGSQYGAQDQQIDDEDFQKPMTDDDFGQITLGTSGNQKQNGNLQSGSQYGLGQQVDDDFQKTDDEFTEITLGRRSNPKSTQNIQNPEAGQQLETHEQQIEDIAKHAQTPLVPDSQSYGSFVPSVNPLQSIKPTTTPKHTSTTRRNRLYPNRYSGITSYQRASTTSSTEHSLAESQRFYNGYNPDFIDHGDYLQHKPQYDFEDITQQQQSPDDYFMPVEQSQPAMTLGDNLRAHTAQQQYAGGPRGQEFNPYQTSQSRKMSSAQNQFDNQQQAFDDDSQKSIETDFVPSYLQREHSYISYTAPSGTYQQQEDIPESKADDKITETEEVIEEEAVTEVAKPLGFWQKVGGKISSGYQTVKQKAKDLVGAN